MKKKAKVHHESPSTSKTNDNQSAFKKTSVNQSASTSKINDNQSAFKKTKDNQSASTSKTNYDQSEFKKTKPKPTAVPYLNKRLPETVKEKLDYAQPYSLFLTHVEGIKAQYNATYALDIKGKLQATVHKIATLSCLATQAQEFSELCKSRDFGLNLAKVFYLFSEDAVFIFFSLADAVDNNTMQ